MVRIENRQVYIVAAVLGLVGLGLFLYKLTNLEYPLLPKERATLWNIEAHVQFRGNGGPASIDLMVPKNTRRYVIVDEAYISRGYGLNTRLQNNNRHAVWTTRRAVSRQDIYYRATVRFLDKSGETEKEPDVSEMEKQHKGDAETHAARAITDDIRARSSDLNSFVSQLFQSLNSPQPDQNVALLLGKAPGRLKRIKAAITVLQASNIAARVVHGVILDESRRNAPVVAWLQVHDRALWRSVDPDAGEIGIPDNYFTWWRGAEPIVDLEGGEDVTVTLSISPSNLPATRILSERDGAKAGLSRFSLFSLPLETQLVYRVLLTIPVGALLLVVMRNVIGIKTFGTFMPILIALSFRETQLVWGLVLFSVVISLGLTVRFYLERLKLLLVPRLASVLIVVVLLMMGLSVLSHSLGLERGLSVALFPMVIMTMTIERMSIVWEERGGNEALRQGLGSLFVATLAYLLMSADLTEHLVFVFPELMLVILAFTLMLGRYSGYRLTELLRFRVLARDR